MKKRGLFIVLAMMLSVSLILVACDSGGSQEPPPAPEPAPSAPEPAAPEPEGPAEVVIDPMDLVYVTNPTTSGYYAIGAGQGGLLTTETPLNIIVTPSTDPVGITAAVKMREADLQINNPQNVLDYFDEVEGDRLLSDIRSIQNGNTLCFSLVTNADLGINTIPDLVGKRVTFDGLSDTHIRVTEAILTSYGVDPVADITRMKMSFSGAGFQDLAEGRTDAVIGSISGSKMEELASKINPLILPVEPAEAKMTSELYPAVVPAELPFDAPGGSKGLSSVGMPTGLFCTYDLPDDVVYVIVKTLVEGYDKLALINPELQEWTPENSVSTNVKFPYHDGAIRYYKEVGLWTNEIDAWNTQQMSVY